MCDPHQIRHISQRQILAHFIDISSQVKLKNKSFDGGIFKIDVISSNADFNGDYPQAVEVSGRGESTIDIAQLIVPDVAEGTIIKVTVRATR